MTRVIFTKILPGVSISREVIFPVFFTFLCDLNFLHENNSHQNQNKPFTLGKEEKKEIALALPMKKIEGL